MWGAVLLGEEALTVEVEGGGADRAGVVAVEARADQRAGGRDHLGELLLGEAQAERLGGLLSHLDTKPCEAR